MPKALIGRIASRDLDEIFDYIASDSHQRALRMTLELLRRCDEIAQHPLTGTRRDDLADRLRCVSHQKYLIFFTPEEYGIQVVRILHGARNFEGLF